jgi:hypothetical protein
MDLLLPAGKNLLDLFAAQERSTLTRVQNRQAGNRIEENADFSRARSSRCQYDASTLQLHFERIARLEAELSAKWTGQDHLAFR